MAGLRTAVMLEAIETLDRHGMPGTVLVQELSADLAKESAYNFASKLNKRVEVVLQYSDIKDDEREAGDEDRDEDEDEKKTKDDDDDDSEMKKKKSQGEKKQEVATDTRSKGPGANENAGKASKSVEDLLDEIV